MGSQEKNKQNNHLLPSSLTKPWPQLHTHVRYELMLSSSLNVACFVNLDKGKKKLPWTVFITCWDLWSLSSTRGRLWTVFFLRGMVLKTRDRCFFSLQQWKYEVILLKWTECIYPWARKGGTWVFALLENWIFAKKLIPNVHGCSTVEAHQFFFHCGVPEFKYSCLLHPVCSSDTILTFFFFNCRGSWCWDREYDCILRSSF